MQEKRLTVRYFMLSFAAGFLILAVAAMLVVLFAPPQMATGAEEKVQIEAGSYLPSNEEAMNFLAVLDTGEENTAKTFFLIRFDPMRGQIPIAAFPQGALWGQAGQMNTLDSVYRYGGLQRVRQQLEASLQIEIHRTIRITGQNVVELVDLLGGVRYRTHETLLLREGGGSTSLPVAYHQLSGGLFYALIQHNAYRAGEVGRCAAAAEMTAALINQYEDLVLSEESDALFTRFVNLVQTDFSAVDYQKMRPAARFMAKLQGEPAFSVSLQWNAEKTKDVFTLMPQGIAQLNEIYSPPKKTA